LGAAASAGAAHANQQRQANDEPMTVKRAAEILGIDENATPAEIRTAHRKLMGKMHPDKDGTDYLAALINEARDYLIARHQDK
jgi:preprotein translocase subunit Sec63